MASTETTTPTPLYSLPNEVLVQILTPFSTRALLPLASVSRRIHAVILRLLHYRLLLLSSLNEYTLLLECFHPVSRLTDPPVYCTYLGTPGLNDKFEGKGSIYENCTSSGYLGRLSSIYSYFRPENDAAEVGDGHWAVGSERLDNGEAGGPLVPRPVTKQVSLEHHEDFSQLCSIVSLVKVIPNTKRLSTVTELDEGVVRLFRDWLKQESQKTRDSNKFDSSKNSKDESSSDILWVNNKPTVGLKLRVREKKWDQAMLPVLMHRDEEDAVSYEVEIEELRIRTTHLLLTIEKSMAEQREYRYAVTIGARQVFPPA